MATIPERYADQPELVAAIIEARSVQMETEDTAFAIEWLLEHVAMSIESATRALGDETFRYPALYPEGHPGLEAMRAEQRVKGRRAYRLAKLRPVIIDRDDGRCQACGKRVEGRDATLDHKDPEGPETLDLPFPFAPYETAHCLVLLVHFALANAHREVQLSGKCQLAIERMEGCMQTGMPQLIPVRDFGLGAWVLLQT